MNNNILYAISTHVDYMETSLPILLSSLKQNEINNRLIVVAGGWKEGCHVPANEPIIYANHNSFEYTALIELVNNPFLYDWVFLLHDTCMCGPKFRELSLEFDHNVDAISTSDWGMNNIGMYRYSYLVKMRGWLNSVKNHKKEDGVNLEGVLYRSAPHRSMYKTDLVNRPPSDVYGTGVQRITEYYPGLDLYKYKAHWQGVASKVINKP